MFKGIIDSKQQLVATNLRINLDAAQLRSYPGTGTAWFDLSGNNSTGVFVNGPTFNSANGGCIITDGVNDYVSTTYLGSVDSNFTFSAWFKNDNYSEEKYIITRGRDGAGAGWSLLLSIATTGLAGAGVVPTLPTVIGIGCSSTTVIPLNTWYYLTGVWISSTSINIYVNGILEGTTLTTGRTRLRTSTNGFQLASVTTGIFTSGATAAVEVYDRALSATEILQNFNARKTRFGY